MKWAKMEALPDSKELLDHKPIVCPDIAAKLLVWSDLVYPKTD